MSSTTSKVYENPVVSSKKTSIITATNEYGKVTTSTLKRISTENKYGRVTTTIVRNGFKTKNKSTKTSKASSTENISGTGNLTSRLANNDTCKLIIIIMIIVNYNI